jgi:hypothetical protein
VPLPARTLVVAATTSPPTTKTRSSTRTSYHNPDHTY